MNLREQILEESLKLFTLKGFLCTSMNDILSACQTSKGGFYNHFPSKEALFDEVVAKARRNWRAKNLVGLEDEPSPVGKVRTMLVNYRDRYLKDTANLPGGCPFVMLAVELADQRPDYARELNRGFRGLRNMIRRLLAEAQAKGELRTAVDTDAVAAMLFAGMLGASVMFGVDKSFARLDSTIDSLIVYLEELCVSTPLNANRPTEKTGAQHGSSKT